MPSVKKSSRSDVQPQPSTASVSEDRENWTEADKRFGYRFAVDGLMGPKEACEFLGGISRLTLDRLVNVDEVIRRGKFPGRKTVGYCRRSVMNYAHSIES